MSSSKKIGYCDSERIASSVASKAFEHLFEPVKIEMERQIKFAYDETVRELDVPYLEKIEMIRLTSICCVRFPTGAVDSDGEAEYDGFDLGERWSSETIYVSSQLKIVRPDLVTLIQEAYKKFEPIRKAQDGLQNKIRCDIQDKTYTKVIKMWPELTGFIPAERRGPTGGVITPFSEYLREHMGQFMALPAPVAA